MTHLITVKLFGIRNAHRTTESDVVYTAEFSLHDLKPESIREGDHVQAEVKDRKLTVRRKDGKKVTAPIIRIQRTIVHPAQP